MFEGVIGDWSSDGGTYKLFLILLLGILITATLITLLIITVT